MVRKANSNTWKGIDDRFLACEFNASPGFTSEQLLVKIKHHVSSIVGDFGQECKQETYLMMSELEVSPKVHRSDTFTQKEGKESIHFTASLDTISMICKLIAKVNHLCILLAVMKYVDDLPKKTLVEALENSTTQVKLTPRELD